MPPNETTFDQRPNDAEVQPSTMSKTNTTLEATIGLGITNETIQTRKHNDYIKTVRVRLMGMMFLRYLSPGFYRLLTLDRHMILQFII